MKIVLRKKTFLLPLCLLALMFLARPAQADPQWTMVWNDEFNGASGSAPDPTHWTYDTGGGGWGNGELETYTNTTANAYLDGNGHLVIQALDNGGNYTSARMKTQGVFDQAYGMIEASIQLPAGGSGIWPAWWMLGQNIGTVGWPACGEIDMLEDGLPWSNTVIGEHVHGPLPGGGDYNGGAGVGNNYSLPSGTVNSGFHTYGVQWSPNQIQFFIDGTIEQTLTPGSIPGGGSYVFNHPFFMLLNLAIGGPSGSPSGTSFPQQMLVDYVRVYKLTDNGTSPYGGTAAVVPGTIQAENFDSYNDTNDPVEPGEGFAYNSLPTNNTSGQDRTGDAISEEVCSDTGGGYDVDYTSPGQWLQYTINVTQSGTYNLDARVASSGQGGSFHFALDGNTVGSEMTCPNTGGWQNWQDVVTNVGNINAGQHVLLLVEDTMGAGNAGVCNFNYINLSLANPPTPTPTFTPVVSSSWRVVAGGPAHTDCNNNNWAADENFNGGTAAATTNTITGALPCSTDQALYQDQRYGNNFSYSFNVPAGSYQVTLKFSETYSGDFAAGDRVFNVAINGTQVLTNLDVYGAVGANTALDKVFNNISPSGGVITIQFTGTTSTDTNADVSALQIIPQPSTPTPTFTVPPCTTSSSTFGNTAAGTGGYNLAGQLDCARYVLSQPMTITSLDIYMGAGTSGSGVLGIYSDAAGVPGSLLVQSNAQVLSTGWDYFVVPPTVLPTGTYWLSGSFTGTAVFDYSASTGGTMAFETYTYTGSLPNALGSTTGYGWLMSIYANGCQQPTVTPTRSPTPMGCGNSTTLYTGSDTSNLVWTNCNAPTAAPPADSGGNPWNSANYNTANATGWDSAFVINPLAGGWTAPCSITGSGITPNWISVSPSAGQGNGPCNGNNGQLFYYAKYFTVPAGSTVTGATLLITGDDGTSGGGTEPFGLYVNGNAVAVASLSWSSCTTISIPAGDIHAGNNIIAFMDENESGGQGIAYQLSYTVQSYTCTPTFTVTSTSTNSPTKTYTPTSTSTPSLTPTNTSTPSFTSTLSYTPTWTWTMTKTLTPTNTPVPPSPTGTPTSSSTASFTSTFTRSATPTSTLTNTPIPPTATFTWTSTFTKSFTPTTTLTPTPSSTPKNTNTPTLTVTGTVPPTSTPTVTLTPTNSPVPLTFTFTPTLTPTAIAPTETFTATITSTNTLAPPTASATASFTSTPAPPTATSTSTFTHTPVPPTMTLTFTGTPTETWTPVFTNTFTPTQTLTWTNTFTATRTNTLIPTNTLTSTATAVPPTFTKTFTPVPTHTFTVTVTFTATLASGCSGVPEWNGNFVAYAAGSEVVYNAELYQCIQAHTSEPNWMPPVVPALWKDLGPCPGTSGVVTLNKVVSYPNPATGGNTTLYYQIVGSPSSGSTGTTVSTIAESGSAVSLKIITVAGRMVWSRNLSGQDAVSGEHQIAWNCKDVMGVNLADGVYYYQVTLKAGGQSQTKTSPLLILK